MKKLFYLSLVTLFFVSCKKGENYCPVPLGLTGFKAHSDVYASDAEIELELTYNDEFNMEIMNNRVMFNFSVPTIFENPKGDRGVDVTEQPKYVYKLKDPLNAPDSVVIEAYGFNDCGKSEVVKTVIRFL